MVDIKFRKDEQGNVLQVTETTNEDVATVDVTNIDNEIIGLKSRIRLLKAMKKAAEAFAAGELSEEVKTIDPSKETLA